MLCPRFYLFRSEETDNKPIYLLFPVAKLVLLHNSWRNSIQQKFIDVPLKFSFWNQRHVDLTAWSTEDRQPSTPTALGMPSTEEGCQIQNYAPSILCPMADRC